MSAETLSVGVTVIGVTVGVYLAVAVLRYSSRTAPSLSFPTGAVTDTVTP